MREAIHSPAFQAEIDKMNMLADELDLLEHLSRTGNREIVYVQAMVLALRKVNIERVKEIALQEGDKLGDIPDVKRFLIDKIFEGTVDENMIPKDFGK